MSKKEIKKVQSLIEQCMLHYLNKNEVIDILYRQQNINPSLTRTVWEILEQQNQEFFKGYYLRVILKQQIMEFNHLLEKQAALMNQMNIDAVASPVEPTRSAMSQGMQSSCVFPMDMLAQNPNVGMLQGTDRITFNSVSGYLGSLLEAHQFATSLDYRFNRLPLTFNDQSNSRTGMQSVFDFPMNMLAQNPNIGILQGTNGLAFNSDSGYISNLRFVAEVPRTLLEARQFATPPYCGFCPLPSVSNDQQYIFGTGQNMNSTAQDFCPRFVKQSERFRKWLINGKWKA